MANRKCLCCSTSYSYCPNCSGSDRLAPTWKSEFCSEDCMAIWTTATKFNLGKLTKVEAKSIISALDLKPVEQYVNCVQRDLGVILKEEPKPKRSKKIEVPVIDEAIFADIIEAIPEDSIVVSEIHEVVNETNENE